MPQPSVILLVKFKSPLNLEQVIRVIDTRLDQFRALEGLQQKYYLQEPDTGEYAGLYLWESEEAYSVFRDSELRATIAEAYETVGMPRIEVFTVIKSLRD